MSTEHRLPESFVREGLALAEGASLFGVPLEEMSRDELRAACAQGWKQAAEARRALAEMAGRALA